MKKALLLFTPVIFTHSHALLQRQKARSSFDHTISRWQESISARLSAAASLLQESTPPSAIQSIACASILHNCHTIFCLSLMTNKITLENPKEDMPHALAGATILETAYRTKNETYITPLFAYFKQHGITIPASTLCNCLAHCGTIPFTLVSPLIKLAPDAQTRQLLWHIALLNGDKVCRVRAQKESARFNKQRGALYLADSTIMEFRAQCDDKTFFDIMTAIALDAELDSAHEMAALTYLLSLP